MTYDFSTAEPPQGDVIPAKTVVPIIIQIQAGDAGTPENAFSITKSGIWQLRLECTVLEGPYKNKKLWQRLTMGAPPGVELTDGQQKGVAISGTMLRSILEAARGFLPTDETPQAMQARKMQSLFELDNMEIWIEVGIDKADPGSNYSDQNKIQKVLPYAKDRTLATAGASQGALPLGNAKPAAAPVAPAVKKPSWAA